MFRVFFRFSCNGLAFSLLFGESTTLFSLFLLPEACSEPEKICFEGKEKADLARLFSPLEKNLMFFLPHPTPPHPTLKKKIARASGASSPRGTSLPATPLRSHLTRKSTFSAPRSPPPTPPGSAYLERAGRGAGLSSTRPLVRRQQRQQRRLLPRLPPPVLLPLPRLPRESLRP